MIWPFDPLNVAVFTTKSVIFGRQPVLLVTHDEKDGVRQFLPREGAGHVKDAAVVGLGETIERDATLAELAELPVGAARMEKITGFALAAAAAAAPNFVTEALRKARASSPHRTTKHSNYARTPEDGPISRDSSYLVGVGHRARQGQTRRILP
jgi:hypothetical protein